MTNYREGACHACNQGITDIEPCECVPTWSGLFGIDPDFECLHEWLLRPESDTHVCLICGAER